MRPLAARVLSVPQLHNVSDGSDAFSSRCWPSADVLAIRQDRPCHSSLARAAAGLRPSAPKTRPAGGGKTETQPLRKAGASICRENGVWSTQIGLFWIAPQMSDFRRHGWGLAETYRCSPDSRVRTASRFFSAQYRPPPTGYSSGRIPLLPGAKRNQTQGCSGST